MTYVAHKEFWHDNLFIALKREAHFKVLLECIRIPISLEHDKPYGLAHDLQLVKPVLKKLFKTGVYVYDTYVSRDNLLLFVWLYG